MIETKGKSFETLVEEVTEKYKSKSLEERNKICEWLTEWYVGVHGKKPDSYQTSLLANLILIEDISNPMPYKSRHEEYPFHSEMQKKRRRKKEFVTQDDTLDHMNYKRQAKLSTAPPKEIKI
ncbi:hypothetical protein [Priestia megaterium]|uniref:hypothetical protein n=1 Tax=Priestia megaterium TaxID=1404 RepID=UPI0023DC96C8|nr:hypothetical protein [Priestia megaterium]MDF2010226.1 hypothetical protein [Priestia megaterium]